MNVVPTDPDYQYHYGWTEEEEQRKFKQDESLSGCQYRLICYYCSYTEYFTYTPWRKSDAIKCMKEHLKICEAEHLLAKKKNVCPTCGK